MAKKVVKKARSAAKRATKAGTGIASRARKGLATLGKDAEKIGSKIMAEGRSVARAGKKRVGNVAKGVKKTAKRTTRKLARGTAKVARRVEKAADSFA
jgi:hypothetical protein